jgi:4-hydroxybenzoate polyprenyltransferase
MTLGWGLLFLTFVLVAVGGSLYVQGYAGWAQLLWVLGSGTAGAGVVMIFDDRYR